MWLRAAATDVWSVPMQCGKRLVAAMLRSQWNELLAASLHPSWRRMQGPRQPYLPPLAAGFHLLG
jgi:hypothetical protein